MMKRFLLAVALIACSTAAMAQAWPAKSIRMIVPLAPGATADIVARLFADELGKSLGQTIVVDNKTGAGGTIATAELARAPADGYTMGLVSQGTMVFNIGLYKTPGYDPLKDLALVAASGGVSNVLIVSPDNPAKTVADLLAQARAKPGELTYASGGVGTSHHMSGVLLELRTGVKDYVFNTWMGFAVPANTPAPVIARLNAEINRIGQLPQVRDKMLAQGIDMLPPESPAAAQKLVRDDLALWLPIIKASGASAE